MFVHITYVHYLVYFEKYVRQFVVVPTSHSILKLTRHNNPVEPSPAR